MTAVSATVDSYRIVAHAVILLKISSVWIRREVNVEVSEAAGVKISLRSSMLYPTIICESKLLGNDL